MKTLTIRYEWQTVQLKQCEIGDYIKDGLGAETTIVMIKDDLYVCWYKENLDFIIYRSRDMLVERYSRVIVREE